ncbi:MAG: OmpA family protein [Bacteroidales bacterium]|nr:OmpA family protein [Bacteroidales bacterium]
MKRSIIYTFSLIFILSATFSSCVSSKKYKELLAKRDSAEIENSKLKDENMLLKTTNTELTSKIGRLEKLVDMLTKDTLDLGRQLRNTSANYKSISKSYNELLQKHNDLLAGNERETKKILEELRSAQTDLMRREDSLAALEREYQVKRTELEKLATELNAARDALAEKELAYNALRREVAKKDSIMNALRDNVAKALTGFENNGLTITNRNGQVYVSMDEKLLFASGSFTVNPKGQEALIKLAKVLETNSDIRILVEGHTDSVPYRGSGNLNDNWDLSVKRATSIVRVLTANSKIDAQRITAAGRGEFLPVDSNKNADGRAKNRRTEIILQPDLEKLYELVK